MFDGRASISRLTEIADLLLSNGELNIYDMTREAIELSDIKWEYQGQDGSIHGPFTSAQIATWQSQGYLTGSTSVMIRRAGASEEELSDSGPAKKRARTAHEEVLGDFEDDDEDKVLKDPVSTILSVSLPDKWTEWVSSDSVDFAEALPSDLEGGGG